MPDLESDILRSFTTPDFKESAELAEDLGTIEDDATSTKTISLLGLSPRNNNDAYLGPYTNGPGLIYSGSSQFILTGFSNEALTMEILTNSLSTDLWDPKTSLVGNPSSWDRWMKETEARVEKMIKEHKLKVAEELKNDRTINEVITIIYCPPEEIRATLKKSSPTEQALLILLLDAFRPDLLILLSLSIDMERAFAIVNEVYNKIEVRTDSETEPTRKEEAVARYLAFKKFLTESGPNLMGEHYYGLIRFVLRFDKPGFAMPELIVRVDMDHMPKLTK